MESREIMKCMEEYRKGGKIGISIIIIIFSFFFTIPNSSLGQANFTQAQLINYLTLCYPMRFLDVTCIKVKNTLFYMKLN